MAYRHIEVAPLTPTIGAVVDGVDLAATDDAAFAEIHAAWMAHLVLFFRQQTLTPAEHLALGRRFGPLHVHPAAPYAHGDPALMVIRTDAASRRNNGAGWHSDVSADERPPLGTILHLHEVPPAGGDTLWASMYAAFDALSPPLQRLLESLTALHQADYAGYYGDHPPQREFPAATHPVVRTHPVTRRKALFVNAGFTRRINELTARESRALLGFLFEHILHPAFQCRVKWGAGDVAMWDNRCAQHMAVWDYFPETRAGLRVAIEGDRPFFDALASTADGKAPTVALPSLAERPPRTAEAASSPSPQGRPEPAPA